MSLKGSSVKGVLLDISGVLSESSTEGDGVAIAGSVEAVEKLKHAGISVRFVTNETQRTRRGLMEKLHRLGFSMREEEIFTPALAAVSLLKKEKDLRPYLLVYPSILPDLKELDVLKDGETANCVIVGDAASCFSYENLNRAFRILMEQGGSDGRLFSLGKGKYYKEDGQLTLDVGAFTAALEFATDREATVCGKPSAEFFTQALADMGVSKEDAVMVGDDVVSDVGGAQRCGIRGVLVRTGKFRREDEEREDVRPDAVVDNLAAFVDQVLQAA